MPVPYPLAKPSARLHAWGRAALWAGLGALGVGEGDEVLMPAYHHGSEVEAVRRRGAGVRFYGGDASLRPEEDELEALLTPGTRALHLIHFLGLPQDSERWRTWCDRHGLLLIEDVAQGWLSTHADGRPVGADGDFAFWCLYKSVGLPEGAVSTGIAPPARRPLDPRRGAKALARHHTRWILGRSGTAHALARVIRGKRAGGDGNFGVAGGDLARGASGAEWPAGDIPEVLALGDAEAMPWSTTSYLAARLGDPSVAARRRAHHAALAAALADLVPQPFGKLPPGASPFALPVVTSDKLRALAHLRARGVVALDLWGVPHPLLPVDAFPEIKERRATTIAVPVHQELRPRDLDQIADAVLSLRS